MGKIRVSPKEPNPTHHIGLTGSDGKTVGLILTDSAGNPDPTGIASQPYPRTAIKTYSGASDLDSEEPPFNPISQRDWSGGMGKLVHDEAANRYREAHGVNTSYPNIAYLQGREEHMLGYRAQNNYDPDSVTWLNEWQYPYRAISFVPTENYSAKYAQVYAKRRGLPTTGTAQFHIYTDTAGEPDTLLASSGYVNVSDMSTWAEEKDDMMILVSSSFSSPPALTAGVTYWLKVDWAIADVDGVMLLAVDTNNKTGALKSATGSVWAGSADAFYYSIRADGAQFDAIFLKYKGCDYMITQNVDKASASKMYIAGDRGLADDNSADKTKLNDATKSWVTNAFAGAYVFIRTGPGVEDEKNWRKIVSNTATSLTVDKAWTTTHTDKTEYAIVGGNYWTLVGDWGAYVYDATVIYDYIFTTSYGSTYQSYQWEIAETSPFAVVEKWRTEPGYLLTRTDWVLGVPQGGTGHYTNSGMAIYAGTSANHGGGTNPGPYTVKGRVLGFQPSSFDDAATTSAATFFTKRIQLYDDSNPTQIFAWSGITGSSLAHTVFHGMPIITVPAAFTTGMIGALDIPSTDFSGTTTIRLTVYVDNNIPAGYLEFGMSDTTLMGGTPLWLPMPALTANKWHVIDLTYQADAAANPKSRAIISLGWKQATDPGAFQWKLYIGSEIYLGSATPYYLTQKPSVLPNKVVLYSGSLDGTTTPNPWYFGQDGSIWERQTQNGDVMTQLYISSGTTQSGPHFGSAAVQHGLYLYFNVGTRLQRYYNNQIDDVGPDRDDGLPDLQKGAIPWDLVSYAGRLYASYYTGNAAYDNDATGHHAIYAEQNNGWCEVVRNMYGKSAPIRRIGTQATPVQRKYIMWVIGGLVMRAPISFDPQRDPDYRFRPDGVIITGRYYAGRRDIEKFFKAVKVTADNLEGIYDTNDVKITLWYRTDIQQSWTQLPDVFDYSPFKQVDLNTLMDATGRWVQFRIMFDTDQSTISPVLYGIVIETMIRVPVKDAYTLTFKLANNDTDLQGNFEDADAKAKYNILREWLAGAKPIKLSTLDELTHGLTVYPEPIPIRRILRTYEEGGQVKTKWVCQMSFLEI